MSGRGQSVLERPVTGKGFKGFGLDLWATIRDKLIWDAKTGEHLLKLLDEGSSRSGLVETTLQ